MRRHRDSVQTLFAAASKDSQSATQTKRLRSHFDDHPGQRRSELPSLGSSTMPIASWQGRLDTEASDHRRRHARQRLDGVGDLPRTPSWPRRRSRPSTCCSTSCAPTPGATGTATRADGWCSSSKSRGERRSKGGPRDVVRAAPGVGVSARTLGGGGGPDAHPAAGRPHGRGDHRHDPR